MDWLYSGELQQIDVWHLYKKHEKEYKISKLQIKISKTKNQESRKLDFIQIVRQLLSPVEVLAC